VIELRLRLFFTVAKDTVKDISKEDKFSLRSLRHDLSLLSKNENKDENGNTIARNVTRSSRPRSEGLGAYSKA
jgi:hypothetical protein